MKIRKGTSKKASGAALGLVGIASYMGAAIISVLLALFVWKAKA